MAKVNWNQHGAQMMFGASASGDPTALQVNSLNYLQTTALPSSNGGTVGGKVRAQATTNATAMKTSAAQVYGVELYNAAAYPVYLKFFNKASAPVVGTDTPVWVIGIPAGGRVDISRPIGRAFSAGIAYAITKLAADNDTTAVAADDLIGSIDYF